jgi:ABC-2 type transport system permease protein
MSLAPDAVAGTIYDIGYRKYEGMRLGRGYAFRTLYVHSLRSAFGLGRGGRALWIPWLLFAGICFPSAVSVAASAFTNGVANLMGYDDVFEWVSLMVSLFCAAQAPELVSRDQQYRVLPLYFSRPLPAVEYAGAKLLATWTAVVILVLTPLLILLVGRLATPADFGAALRAESRYFLPILGTPLVAALGVGTPALALASLVQRRWLATAVAFGFFFVTAPIAAILTETLSGDASRFAVLVNPIMMVGGAILAMFGSKPDGILKEANLGPEVYGLGVAVLALASVALLLTRYRRMSV